MNIPSRVPTKQSFPFPPSRNSAPRMTVLPTIGNQRRQNRISPSTKPPTPLSESVLLKSVCSYGLFSFSDLSGNVFRRREILPLFHTRLYCPLHSQGGQTGNHGRKYHFRPCRFSFHISIFSQPLSAFFTFYAAVTPIIHPFPKEIFLRAGQDSVNTPQASTYF